jgi:hypothetical protein
MVEGSPWCGSDVELLIRFITMSGHIGFICMSGCDNVTPADGISSKDRSRKISFDETVDDAEGDGGGIGLGRRPVRYRIEPTFGGPELHWRRFVDVESPEIDMGGSEGEPDGDAGCGPNKRSVVLSFSLLSIEFSRLDFNSAL